MANMIWEPGASVHNQNAYLTCPLSILLLILILLSGCTRQEEAKKVSLYKRADRVTLSSDHLHPNTLWFGFDLGLGPKEEVRIYIPFLKYLERATGKRFRIKFTEKYEDTVDNLGRGITHFASLGTLNYVTGVHKYGIKYLVSGVNKEGDPRYQSVIFTKRESDITSLKDMKGRCFAFGSKMSTEGHLIPRKMLHDAGITLKDLSSYVYTGSHINAVKAVLNGKCDAGGIQDSLAGRLALEGKIRVIGISEPYPGSLIAYNSDVDSEIIEAVRKALLAFEPSGKDKNALFDWDKSGMPLGFSVINELELDKVMSLAKEYGLLIE